MTTRMGMVSRDFLERTSFSFLYSITHKLPPHEALAIFSPTFRAAPNREKSGEEETLVHELNLSVFVDRFLVQDVQVGGALEMSWSRLKLMER
ncbi:hypothetical protein PAMP_016979 [Pampus punctatissimus]